MAGKGLYGRHPLRPSADVLVVREAAMVLGTLETRHAGADRQSLPHGSSSGPRLDASDQGTVRFVAESSGWHAESGCLCRADEADPRRGRKPIVAWLLQRARVRVLQGLVGASAEPVDLCGSRGSRADEQCCGAGVASGGDLAKVVVRYAVGRGEPICRAATDGSGNLSEAKAERTRLDG